MPSPLAATGGRSAGSAIGSPVPDPTAVDGLLGVANATSPVVALLSGVGTTDVLAWTSILLFVAAIALQWRGNPAPAARIAAVAWIVFGIFWLTMAPYYHYEVRSPLQTVLAIAALPLCVYTGYLLYGGRQSLLLLTKAVAIMGLIYLPAETIPVVRTWLIETTAAQTHFGMELVGHSPGIEEGDNGYVSRFAFDSDETVTGRTTYIVLACTGIGSMAIFGGLIAAVKAPLRRKLTALALSVGIIWFLNLVRNVFIGLASPWGWFQQDWLVDLLTTYTGAEASRVSYIVAHNYVSQPLSIVVLLAITYLVVRILPEVLGPLEEALFVLTGAEYDLESAIGEPVRADGGDARADGGDDGNADD